MKTVSEKVTISNKLGLHARPAAELVKLVSQFSAEVTLTAKKQTINAKSIMGVLMLAASRGTEITITATGNDAPDAVEKVRKLIENKFGEE